MKPTSGAEHDTHRHTTHTPRIRMWTLERLQSGSNRVGVRGRVGRTAERTHEKFATLCVIQIYTYSCIAVRYETNVLLYRVRDAKTTT